MSSQPESVFCEMSEESDAGDDAGFLEESPSGRWLKHQEEVITC